MQEKHLFEYAVIRVVPRVEREEFINVGIILFCAKQKFLKSIYHLDWTKLNTMNSDIDREELLNHLDSFQNIANGGLIAGPIGLFDDPSRFRWLTATRSTVVQCSKVHPGFCKDADETMHKLLEQLVL